MCVCVCVCACVCVHFNGVTYFTYEKSCKAAIWTVLHIYFTFGHKQQRSELILSVVLFLEQLHESFFKRLLLRLIKQYAVKTYKEQILNMHS